MITPMLISFVVKSNNDYIEIQRMNKAANILVELKNSIPESDSDSEDTIIESDNRIIVTKENSEFYNKVGYIIGSGNGFYHIKLHNNEIIKLRKHQYKCI
jgi:hypothetical protein